MNSITLKMFKLYRHKAAEAIYQKVNSTCWQGKIMGKFVFFFHIFQLFYNEHITHLFIYWPRHAACGTLVPRPGIEPRPKAVKAPSPNHWAAREVSPRIHYFYNKEKTLQTFF